MFKGIKIRLFPTEEQVIKLWKSIGTARWVWNWGISYNNKLYSKENRFAFDCELKKEFTKVRNSGEYIWLKEVAAKVPAVTLITLGNSYKRYFSMRKRGLKVGLPKFKKKGKCKDSFGLDNSTIVFYEDGIQILKIGYIKFKSDISLNELQKIKIYDPRITFSHGKWIFSCSIEIQNNKIELNNYSVGIDLGVKTLAVASCDGKFYKAKNINKSYKMIRLNKQLKHKQREFARKEKDSNNRKKALCSVQKCYEKITNIRKNYAHQVTRKIINLNPKRIIMEDLNVQGMLKNKHIARAILEQGFYRFREFVRYKSEQNGIEFCLVDRYYPSSKKCSFCGHVVKKLSLSQRIYKCPICGLEIDRDENASLNIEKAM